MNVGNRIKQRRKELGISVDELAVILNKNRATLYRYETEDIETLSIETLEPIAKALNTNPAYLMGWTDDNSRYLSLIGNDSGGVYIKHNQLQSYFKNEDEFTDEEIDEIIKFAEFLKSKRAK